MLGTLALITITAEQLNRYPVQLADARAVSSSWAALSSVPSRFPHLVEPQRWRQNLDSDLGIEDAAHGVRTGEARTTTARAGADAPSHRGLQGAGDEVPDGQVVQRSVGPRQAQATSATTEF